MTSKISIAGGDTDQEINLNKRGELIASRCPDLVSPLFLDCGCGAGGYVRKFLNQGWEAKGLEFLEEKISKARQAGLGPDRVTRGDAENMPYDSESFDILLFNEVLEHVPSDGNALAEAYRVLKPGGRLFVFSPNRLYPFESHGVYPKGKKKKLPVWTPFVPYVPLCIGNRLFDYWARNYWPGQLRKLVKDAGFDIQETSFVWQTFEGISGDGSFLLRHARPALRKISMFLERVPLVNTLGVSQFIYARKANPGPRGSAGVAHGTGG